MIYRYPVILLSLFVTNAAFAEGSDYTPGAQELAPAEEIKCDWSKLSSTQYSACQKRKEYYESQTPKEQVQQNVRARANRVAQGIASADDGGGALRRARPKAHGR